MYLYVASHTGTAESRVVFKMHDFLKNNLQDTVVLKYMSQVSVAFSFEVCCFPANVTLFSTRQPTWGKKKTTPGKGLDSIIFSRSACSIWAYSCLKSAPEQHETMQNTFGRMQKLELEKALMSVPKNIHCCGKSNHCHINRFTYIAYIRRRKVFSRLVLYKEDSDPPRIN